MRTDQVIEQFLAWVERKRDPSTLKFYTDRLRLFRAKYGDREFRRYDDQATPPDDPERTFTPLLIDEFLHAIGQGQSASTQVHNANALSILQKFALRNGLMRREGQIFDRLDKPKAGRRDRVPTADEIARLLAPASPEFRRIYQALCRCGARPSEICGLRIEEHVDWAKRLLRIKEHKTARKTGKDRLIPIGKKLEVILREAIGERTAGPVFLTPRGAAWTPTHLTAVHRALRDQAALGDDFVLYLTRHRFATELLRLGKDIKQVADLLGHEDIATTQRYQHPDLQELGEFQDLLD